MARPHKTYDAYKDSGIAWLGDIPEGWSVLNCKFAYSIQLGKMLQNDPENSEDIQVPYLKALNVQWEMIDTEHFSHMWVSPSDFEKYSVKDGDLLVCEGGEVGRAAILKNSPQNCIIQNALHRVRVKKGNNLKYLVYLLETASSSQWLNIICNRATIAHFTDEKFGSLRIALPLHKEQKAIVDFLDAKSEQINSLIEKKQKQIELLQEKRAALITQAVTKGLNPKVKMKPSGITWLGDIPEHWDIWKYSRLYKSGMGETILTENLFDEGFIPVMSATEKEDVLGYVANARTMLSAGDLIIPARGNSIGYVKLVKEECTSTQTTIFSKSVSDKTVSEFVYYYLNAFRPVLFFFDRTAIPQITVENVSCNPIVVPPLDEQKTIANFLDKETAKIDNLAHKIEASIALLEEYRTALITSAVTGTIDVRAS